MRSAGGWSSSLDACFSKALMRFVTDSLMYSSPPVLSSPSGSCFTGGGPAIVPSGTRLGGGGGNGQVSSLPGVIIPVGGGGGGGTGAFISCEVSLGASV